MGGTQQSRPFAGTATGENLSTGSVDLTRSDAFMLPANAQIFETREMGAYERFGKPLIDRSVALILIVLTLPLLIAGAVAVRVTMGSPVLLRQHRVGRYGRVFTVYKLRTMHADRRSNSHPFVGTERRFTHKHPDDPRITSVGRFLRRTSIDELPQLFNVLIGEMSLVGPRPELVDIVARYEDWQHQRHHVKPGLTCTWQVKERGITALQDATPLDLEYIESISLGKDLQLLAVTPLAILSRRGS